MWSAHDTFVSCGWIDRLGGVCGFIVIVFLIIIFFHISLMMLMFFCLKVFLNLCLNIKDLLWLARQNILLLIYYSFFINILGVFLKKYVALKYFQLLALIGIYYLFIKISFSNFSLYWIIKPSFCLSKMCYHKIWF